MTKDEMRDAAGAPRKVLEVLREYIDTLARDSEVHAALIDKEVDLQDMVKCCEVLHDMMITHENMFHQLDELAESMKQFRAEKERDIARRFGQDKVDLAKEAFDQGFAAGRESAFQEQRGTAGN